MNEEMSGMRVNVIIEEVELTILCLCRGGEQVIWYEERKLEV